MENIGDYLFIDPYEKETLLEGVKDFVSIFLNQYY
jgi:hypothetical protein